MPTNIAVAKHLELVGGWWDASETSTQRSQRRVTDAEIVELLVTSGVRMVTWHLPDEITEGHEGDPIDHDDLLDFHALLETDDWMDGLEKMTSR